MRLWTGACSRAPLANRADIEAAAIEGAVQRLRPKLMTVAAVLASLVPILWETGIGSDVMKPIAAPIVGGMITSTIHVLILVPVFFVMMKARALRQGKLQRSQRSRCVRMPLREDASLANTPTQRGNIDK